jgi:hypothetical protein
MTASHRRRDRDNGRVAVQRPRSEETNGIGAVAVGGGRSDPARAEYSARIELTYQLAVRARAQREGAADIAAAATARIAEIERRPFAADGMMARLAARVGLPPMSVDFLWAAVACAFDGRIVPHLEALGGLHGRRGLSVAVYAALAGLDGEAAARLSRWLADANPLVANGLLVPAEDVTPAARAYVASPRLAAYLSNDRHDIAPLRRVRRPVVDLLHGAVELARIERVRVALAADPRAIVVVEGVRGSGRVTGVACAHDRDLVVLDLSRVPDADVPEALVALRREAVLDDVLLVLANADDGIREERPQSRATIGRFIEASPGHLVVTITVPGTDLGIERPVVRIPWEVPDTATRAALWTRVAGRAGIAIDGPVEDLALRYRVGPAAIERAVASARMLRPQAAALDGAALIAGLRHNIAERLGGLARRVDVTQSWDDLVIAEDIADQITALIGRIRHAHHVLEHWGYRRAIARGTGVAALFSGPPGTGKTMVAGLIARELDLELYQVDLSKVVSKWVGETEKHLAQVFDAAEEGHALLLFDEADALFGERSTDVRGAVDRYANLEVNYLLQRIEAFGGITVLTTNLASALDPAVQRRLASHILFAAPDEDERCQLWERHARTGTAPIASDVEFEALAKAFPNMTGAHIRNAVLAAAFLAAGDGATVISHDHFVRAGRAEYRSMGHVLAERTSVARPKSSLF